MTPDLRRRLAGFAAPAVVVLAAVVARSQLVFATWLSWYDDGVFRASATAMRRGEVPFRDVFSSQGPVFLPVVWLFDMVGLRQSWAPRLSMMAAGVVIGLCVYVICAQLTNRWAAATLGVVAAISGTVLSGSGPLQSDGMAMAFGLVALSVAATRVDRSWAPFVAGLFIGLALATKSLLVLPIVVATVVVFVLLRGVWTVLVVGAVAAGTGLAFAIPFGLDNVWEQYIEFHTEVPRDIVVGENLSLTRRYLMRLDLTTIVLAAIAAAAVGWSAWTGRGEKSSAGQTRGRWFAANAVVVGAVVWIVGSVLVLLLLSELEPGRIRYVGFLIPPLLVLIAAAKVKTWIMVLAVVILLPLHVGRNESYLDPRPMNATERAVVAALEEIPSGALIVTDEQGLVVAADRGVATEMVDTSYARIEAGDVTSADVIASAANEDVCAVLLYSGRFDRLDGELSQDLTQVGYRVTQHFGDDGLLMERNDCPVD